MTVNRSRADEVYDALLSRIVSGSLAPGSRVVERDIAERLDVSRTPVRDAIRRLATEGFIETESDSRYDRPVVASLTEEDARDLHDMVMALETVVARRVAALDDEVRSRVAERVRTANERFREMGTRDPVDASSLVDADHAVHAAYIEAGAGARLLTLRASVKPQLDRYAFAYGGQMGAAIVPAAAAEHDAIADAIEAGDVDGAGVAVMKNWENAARRLRAAIRRTGERGEW